jgi:hypothetical protein
MKKLKTLCGISTIFLSAVCLISLCAAKSSPAAAGRSYSMMESGHIQDYDGSIGIIPENWSEEFNANEFDHIVDKPFSTFSI